MKKFFGFLVIAFMACFFAAPGMGKAEAAKVVVLPLVNMETEENTASAIFMKEAVEFFKYPSYDFVGDDVLEPILAKENYAVVSKKGPNEAMLRRIMKAADADIIVMMRLNEFKEVFDNSGGEMLDKVSIDANVMSVNAFTNKVYSKKINKVNDIEYVFVVRSDWKNDQFTKACRKTFKDIAKG